jgi:hypothetical protein
MKPVHHRTHQEIEEALLVCELEGRRVELARQRVLLAREVVSLARQAVVLLAFAVVLALALIR